MAKELYKLNLKEAAEKLKNEEITSVELTKVFLKRIEKINPEIN